MPLGADHVRRVGRVAAKNLSGGGAYTSRVAPPSDQVGLDAPSAAEHLDQLETHRRELTGYCYRMLGSGFEAEDAVQETMVRAWRNIDRFEGRSSLRSWLYRIATNVCLDMHRGPQRRARPMDLGPSSTPETLIDTGLPESNWIQPMHDTQLFGSQADPAERAASRDTVRLAFVAALQHLPPRQRAVLVLREVLGFHADETAELLDSTVASVNSALQRARATLEAVGGTPTAMPTLDQEYQDLLDRYVDAFERYDVDGLVSLLHEDATMSMPPFQLWVQGANEIGRWHLGQGIGCKGSRVLRTMANGCPVVATYKPSGDGRLRPWSIQVVEISDGRIVALNNFIYPELFEAFGLPAELDPEAPEGEITVDR
jgi:RNA polymerase sigma-70 factor (ECF subfamily)